MTKQMVAQHQAMGGGYKGREDRRGGKRGEGKAGLAEWQTVGDRDARKKVQDKVDTSRIKNLIKRKDPSKEVRGVSAVNVVVLTLHLLCLVHICPSRPWGRPACGQGAGRLQRLLLMWGGVRESGTSESTPSP